MSLATDVRSYADQALEQSRTALTQAQAALVDAPKRLAETAPKPAYAAVGAADAVTEAISKHIETLPADSKAKVSKAQTELVAKVTDLRTKFDTRVESAKGLKDIDFQAKAKGKAKETATSYKASLESYKTNVLAKYDVFVARGEAKVAELRQNPRVVKLVDDVEDVVETAQAKVKPVVDQVEARVKPVVSPYVGQVVSTVKSVAPKSAAKPVAVKKATPVKTAAPAKKAAAKKAPARKATATKA